VYAIDLPGWGFSELNKEAHTLEDDVAAVQGFVNALGIKRFILCGISYGAGVAWASAAMRMPGLERIVLLNPMAPNPLQFILSPLYHAIFALNLSRTATVVGHKMMRKSQYKAICRENLLNERLLDTFYLDLAYLVVKQPKMPFILNAHAKGAHNTPWEEWESRLADLDTPTSILQGLNDRVFTYQSANHLYELIPHSELIDVHGCGHAMVFDQHQVVSDFLIKALARAEERKEIFVRSQSS
jgi:pimeloyl-ACP methyl ester carboxylesterase